jgi:hypothetical protein
MRWLVAVRHMSTRTDNGWPGPSVCWILSRQVPLSVTMSGAPSRHVQDEGLIERPQVLRVAGNDMKVALPRAEGNRHVNHIGVA